ncbi:aldo/keto reductase [Bacteriovoracales bacterium]|nr:aldo/keto reductase [Bacteriovoracales bacterium]
MGIERQSVIIGTVQFGLPYGVSNKKGKVQFDEVKEILDFAHQNNVRELDTAYNYGDSQNILGLYNEIRPKNKFRFISKLPEIEGEEVNPQDIEVYRVKLQETLCNLKIDKFDTLLLHSGKDILKKGGKALPEFLESVKSQGIVRKIGVSVYEEEEIEKVIGVFRPDVIQLPINFFDQRLLKTGTLQDLKEKGIEIHARSIFLQGLIFLGPNNLNSYFDPIKETFLNYYNYLSSNKIKPVQAAIQFIKNIQEVDKITVGVTSKNELLEIIRTYKETKKEEIPFESWAVNDSRYVNPSKWSLT